MPSVPEERWSHLQPLRSSSSLVQEHAAMSEERGEGSWGEGKGGVGKGGTGGVAKESYISSECCEL